MIILGKPAQYIIS